MAMPGLKKIIVQQLLIWLVLGCLGGWLWAVMPAQAEESAGAGPMLEKPPITSELPAPTEGAPSTCGPLINDTCIPIEEHHTCLQVLWGLSVYPSAFSPNWRHSDAKGDFYTFQMPVKFTYGPTKNLETYIVVPFIANWCNNLSPDLAGPNGERSASYAGIGDISTFAKYLILEEGPIRPAVSLVGGVGWPSGHGSHLNPVFLGQDAVGTGSFSFVTGVDLYKWAKPFLLYSNIWLNSPVNLYRLTGSDFPQAVRNRENVTFNLAAEYPLNQQWILLLEMYSTWTWSNPGTESIGFQSPTTVLGFLPGIEYLYSEHWGFSAGCTFDTVGKFASPKFTPIVSACYNF
jgi:Putative MetA-pathway of phenol degradation